MTISDKADQLDNRWATEEYIRIRPVVDNGLWRSMRVLIQTMMEYGFTKTQIHDFVTSTKKRNEDDR